MAAHYRLVVTLLAASAAVVAGSHAAPLAPARRGVARVSPLTRRARGASAAGPMMAAGAGDVAAIVLAGGVGSRMKASMPKQLLDLCGKPVMMHSLELFLSLECVVKVVLVLDAQYHELVAELRAQHGERLVFAAPGAERQDSVANGLALVPEGVELVAVHDSARPLVTEACVMRCIADAAEHGASIPAVPCKATIKEGDKDGAFVARTLQRSLLWEVQTPQVVRVDTLRRGFAKVRAEGLEVTDDASIVEALGEPVKISAGEYTNLKLTTPEDLVIATDLLQRGAVGM